MHNSLIRMGSFTTDPKIPNEDSGDPDAEFFSEMTWQELKNFCQEKLNGTPNPIFNRELVKLKQRKRTTFTVMQWNILSQALADGRDKFPSCPKKALTWSTRRWKILQEIAIMKPDILCLQEVDHYKFFERALASVGMVGNFLPKPDSPCLYIPNNNGPDGCAVFINKKLFEIIEVRNRILEISNCQTNQVALFVKIRRHTDGVEMWIASTHLKAMTGLICMGLRREQGTDLVNYVKTGLNDSLPVMICGDFNAPPKEPIHDIFDENKYRRAYINQVPIPYTTWTIREEGESAKVLDYIYYTKGAFACEALYRMPGYKDLDEKRAPSIKHPSDHFSLVANFITQ